MHSCHRYGHASNICSYRWSENNASQGAILLMAVQAETISISVNQKWNKSAAKVAMRAYNISITAFLLLDFSCLSHCLLLSVVCIWFFSFAEMSHWATFIHIRPLHFDRRGFCSLLLATHSSCVHKTWTTHSHLCNLYSIFSHLPSARHVVDCIECIRYAIKSALRVDDEIAIVWVEEIWTTSDSEYEMSNFEHCKRRICERAACAILIGFNLKQSMLCPEKIHGSSD